MSARGLRTQILKGYQRRKTKINLDLSIALPGQAGLQEGSLGNLQEGNSGNLESQATEASHSMAPAPIAVDDDDDVIESSPRAFEEARNKSRRRRVMDVESGTSELQIYRNVIRNCYRRKRLLSSNQPVINCDQYPESSSTSKNDCALKSPEQPQSVPPSSSLPTPPPPLQPVFNCPICLGAFSEEMSTKCGHIFCKKCIKAVIATQAKCPTCRKKLTAKDVHRVYLPATSLK